MDGCESCWDEAPGAGAVQGRERQLVSMPEVEKEKGCIVQVQDWPWISVGATCSICWKEEMMGKEGGVVRKAEFWGMEKIV